MAIVIISKELNRGGFRILPEGVDLTNYKKNPILLFMHRRSSHWSKNDNRLPIGKIENIRLEGGQVVADDPIFDEDDAFAMEVKRKWDKGMLNAVSPGLTPMTISDDPSYLVQGQTRATVVSSEMLELSIVDIPKDGNAVRLNLSNEETVDDILPKLNLQTKNNQPEMDLKNIAIELGLPESSTEAEILAALKSKDATIEKLNADKVTELLSAGEAAGVITEDNKAQWEKLAKADFESTSVLLKNATPATAAKKEEVSVKALLAAAKAGNENLQTKDEGDQSKWSFDDWSKNDPDGLNQLRLNNNAKYEQLIAGSSKTVNGFKIEK